MAAAAVSVTAPAADELVASPCRRACCLDEQDICIGCGRLLAEIREWKAADSRRRREICRVAQTRVRPSPLSGG
ncbi:DUF1289 domain-containing protein [Pseudomonas sp. 2FG]|uniref:DUF1289 domain-containing protein n=1 Tax=Pseudomonas sp. 2FG TaxID=2502191 RepID=UPI0010F75A39|nr:DUF1289 domain-containing protein [Pseudomonas sp. 2FG]